VTDVLISVAARDELESLGPDIRERIKTKLREEIAPAPERHLLRLSNSEDFRARVGDYRLIIEWDKQADVLKVHTVGHRRNVYD
jgi:mRNA interferase RelE/StbE